MSVYKHPKGRTYDYDFKLRGVRFRGNTGATTEREAKKVEARIRAEAEAGITSAKPKLKEMPLRIACGRYWIEVGQHLAAAPTIEGQLERLMNGLGKNKLLSQITTDDLTAYQAEARATRKGQKGKPISNRTINGEVPELISAIFKRARMWKVNTGEPIEWSDLKLTLPQHRTRAGKRKEMVLLLRRLWRDYRPVIRFALLTGLRRKALLVKKSWIDWDAMILEYPKKSKRTGDKGWLPITRAMEKILRAECDKSDSEYVFTFVCRRGNRDHRKGQRYPITAEGLKTEMQKAVKAAGLEDWRLIHDLRHTAATRTLRKTRDLTLVQKQLGHAAIGQTSRYAHVLLEDLREALEDAA